MCMIWSVAILRAIMIILLFTGVIALCARFSSILAQTEWVLLQWYEWIFYERIAFTSKLDCMHISNNNTLDSLTWMSKKIVQLWLWIWWFTKLIYSLVGFVFVCVVRKFHTRFWVCVSEKRVVLHGLQSTKSLWLMDVETRNGLSKSFNYMQAYRVTQTPINWNMSSFVFKIGCCFFSELKFNAQQHLRNHQLCFETIDEMCDQSHAQKLCMNCNSFVTSLNEVIVSFFFCSQCKLSRAIRSLFWHSDSTGCGNNFVCTLTTCAMQCATVKEHTREYACDILPRYGVNLHLWLRISATQLRTLWQTNRTFRLNLSNAKHVLHTQRIPLILSAHNCFRPHITRTCKHHSFTEWTK